MLLKNSFLNETIEPSTREAVVAIWLLKLYSSQ